MTGKKLEMFRPSSAARRRLIRKRRNLFSTALLFQPSAGDRLRGWHNTKNEVYRMPKQEGQKSAAGAIAHFEQQTDENHR